MWPFVERPKYKHPATLCAWCPKNGRAQLVMQWVTTHSAKPPKLSHGICATCAVKMDAEITAMESATVGSYDGPRAA
jgi:hypothetical protein